MELHYAAPKKYMPNPVDKDGRFRIEWRALDPVTNKWSENRIAKRHVVGYLMDILDVATRVVPGCADIDGFDITGRLEVQVFDESRDSSPFAIYRFMKEGKYSKPVQCRKDWSPLI